MKIARVISRLNIQVYTLVTHRCRRLSSLVYAVSALDLSATATETSLRFKIPSYVLTGSNVIVKYVTALHGNVYIIITHEAAWYTISVVSVSQTSDENFRKN